MHEHVVYGLLYSDNMAFIYFVCRKKVLLIKRIIHYEYIFFFIYICNSFNFWNLIYINKIKIILKFSLAILQYFKPKMYEIDLNLHCILKKYIFIEI